MKPTDYSDYTVARPSGPPPPRKKRYALWSVPPGERTILRPLQPAPVLVYTHYLPEERRTIFCGGDLGGCAVLHDVYPVRWAGYLWCEMVRPSRGLVIWHITPGCAAACPALMDATRSLANAKIEAWRDGKTNRAPVLAEVAHGFYTGRLPTSDFDLFEHLKEVYAAPNNDVRRNIRHVGQSLPPSDR